MRPGGRRRSGRRYMGWSERTDPGGRMSAARPEVIATARTMAAEGLVAGMVGNVSRRIGDRILATPTRLSYSEMRDEDLVVVDLGGERLEGGRRPSRELPLHLAIYARRPDVQALVHTHSPYATAWSFLGEELLPTIEDNTYHGIGPVRTNRPAPSGSARLAETAAQALAKSGAVLLGRHGVVAAGSSLAEALEVARAVEHQAQVAWILRGHALESVAGHDVDRPGWPEASRAIASPCPTPMHSAATP